MGEDYFKDYEVGYVSFRDAIDKLSALEIVLDEVGAPDRAYDYLDKAISYLEDIATMYDSLSSESEYPESVNPIAETIDDLRSHKNALETAEGITEDQWNKEYIQYMKKVQDFSSRVAHMKKPSQSLQKEISELEDVTPPAYLEIEKKDIFDAHRIKGRLIYDSILRING